MMNILDWERADSDSQVSYKIIQSNFDVFNFKLSPEDIMAIDMFDCNGRICPLEW